MKRRSYFPALFRQSLTAAASNRKPFAILGFGMLLQNILFLLLWVVFFHSVHEIGGWGLREVMLLQGMAAGGYGCAFFVGDGSRGLAERIRTGEIDAFLVRPRRPLAQLIALDANASSPGDFAYGFLLIALATHGPKDMAFALAGMLCIAVLFLAMVVIFQSLAFFMNGGGRLADELFTMLICIGTVPQQTQGIVLKLFIFTIIPAGFMTIVPVEMIREGSLKFLAIMLGACCFYSVAAVAIFQAGLKRYTSATGWQA